MKHQIAAIRKIGATRLASNALIPALFALGIVAPRAAFAQGATPPAPANGFARVQGFVIDSVHNGPLSNAVVLVEGASRQTMTDVDGHFVLDSIPPGQHRVLVLSAVLDTLGLSMRTPPYTFTANKANELDLSIPSPQRIANAICTSAQRNLGPAVMVGFVRDPDTKEPAIGAKVQLVFYVADIIGRKQLRTRETPVDSSGLYKICGLPGDMSGKVQVFRNGVSSGEVAAEVTNGFLALRGFSIVGKHETMVAIKTDSGKTKMVARGSARVTGRVLDKKGQPLRDARVMLQGGGDVVLTKPNGEFTLDSLPSGTQALEVRKLGYSVTEVPVELSALQPATANVTMSDAVPLLQTMRVEATKDAGLSKVGYLERKQTGMGYFMDGNQINHESISFADVMRTAPGITVVPLGDGHTYVITDSRNQAGGGCVNFYVDGTKWTEMSPGDVSTYVNPSELVAVEIYHGSETPAQFTSPGMSSCATVVAWTIARIGTQSPNKRSP
jgi:Carboxypeptidase regulatory-like domain